MKVAILSLSCRIGDKTGDMVQADKTANALRDLGLEVLRVFFNPGTGEVFDGNGKLIGLWENVLADRDIVHAIPPVPWRFVASLPRLRARFVCSPVFWRSYAYTRVLQIVERRLTFQMIKDYVRTFLAWLGMPTYTSYVGYDLLLPNSEDEIRTLKRYCRIKKDVKVVAVPNAIDPLPGFVDELERSDLVPNEDYILVPGCFAPRKNQLRFIQAMRDMPYPVVFIGEGLLLESCRNVANANMIFLGHISHGTKEFYSILKYARIVCLPSNCETPGIAALEAAALGARPVVPYEGGTCQYYGWDAVYLDPLSIKGMQTAVRNAWERGRLKRSESSRYCEMGWRHCGVMTINAYGTLHL